MPTNPNPRLAGLTEEENALLSGCQSILKRDTWPLPTTEKAVMADLTIDALESLARSRASEDRKRKLLEKHQWASNPRFPANYFCPECDGDSVKGHAPGCAIAAELAETGE